MVLALGNVDSAGIVCVCGCGSDPSRDLDALRLLKNELNAVESCVDAEADGKEKTNAGADADEGEGGDERVLDNVATAGSGARAWTAGTGSEEKPNDGTGTGSGSGAVTVA